MAEFNSTNAEAEVLTFKEGMLSPMAHDLRIAVRTFVIKVEDGHVEAEFDLSSLHVVTALKAGEDAPEALSTSDRKKIEATMRDDVLHTKRYPSTFFEADLAELEHDHVTGRLDLHGEQRDVMAKIYEQENGVLIEVSVHQPDFGIKPYSAMMGTLRIKPDVVICALLRDVRVADLID